MRTIYQNSPLAEHPVIIRELVGCSLPDADVVDEALPGGVEHTRVIAKVDGAYY